MKPLRIAFSLLAVLVPTIAASAGVPSVLEELGTNLRTVRSLPVGTKFVFRCPENLEALKGIPKALVSDRLSAPDVEIGNTRTYIISSPKVAGERGGGSPEITFIFGKSQKVEGITCNYAR